MLKKLQYSFFTTREIRPQGWVRRQLEIQAAGLAGNLDRVWRDVRDSRWIGGDAEGWERVPYWLDGFIPLAYLLDDADMIARAERYMEKIMDSQAEDGWICPCAKEERRGYDNWAVILICKVLALYADCSGSARAEQVLSKTLRNFSDFLNYNTLHMWGNPRWFEALIPAFWLYERTGEAWILTLCKKLKVQGFDWEAVFDLGLLSDCTTVWDFYTHVVNLGMMLKSSALMSRLNGGDPDAFAKRALSYLLTHHGMANHHFNGDEDLAAISPLHGTELCGVVEAMYSYEQLFSISGDPYWMDMLETLAFNALPATVSADMWTHQYVQMSNQVSCLPFETGKQPFRTNGVDSHLFGLEPNFGCCTANMGQGFPKLALSACMRAENGIVVGTPIPVTVESTVGGTPVSLTVDTEYPFDGDVTYRVRTERPVSFTLYLRIPDSASSATLNGEEVTPGTIHPVRRVWEKESSLCLRLEFVPRYESRPDGLFCVWRGPLLYALPIASRWERVEYERNGVERKYPYCDYHITPTTEWRYGFDGEPWDFAFEKHGVGNTPFDEAAPPVSLTVPMARVPWQYADGACGKTPDSNIPEGKTEWCRLIPYGCTTLRITETYRVKREE